MLYIYLGAQYIKILHLKKSLLGQYETAFTQKKLEVNLLQDGKAANPDVIASGIKEILQTLPSAPVKEKEVTLILPQDSFHFFRSELPVEVTQSVLTSFIQEKAKSEVNVDTVTTPYDYLIQESEGKKQILFYSLNSEIADSFTKPFDLLEMKVVSIIPESLTYFKLFDKTLRQNKKENIWYISYEQEGVEGYLYDSYGLLENEHWRYSFTKKDKVEEVLQKQAAKYTAQNSKLNRLILSGSQADTVRQDMFTKNVGVWTNPLKRIISHFYVDYLKMLGTEDVKTLPITEYDMLIGAFIFSLENKNFNLMKAGGNGGKTSLLPSLPSSLPVRKMPVKGIAFFLISFVLTFAILFGLSQMKWGNGISMPSLSLFSKPTPTPTNTPTPLPPTPTPTPAIVRAEVKIKVLNGSGIAGKAGDVKDFLKEKGYEEILTANADDFDYTTTVIKVKEDAEPGMEEFVAKDLSERVEKPKFDTLEKDEAADVVIIVGTDFK